MSDEKKPTPWLDMMTGQPAKKCEGFDRGCSNPVEFLGDELCGWCKEKADKA